MDEKTVVGNLSKQYAGFINEAFTTADRFGVTCNFNILDFFYKLRVKLLIFMLFIQVPKDMSVKTKITMVAALFLIVSCFNFLPLLIENLKP